MERTDDPPFPDDCSISYFLGNYVFHSERKDKVVSNRTEYHAGIMLHRILRDILMFAGIYDYLGDWGWIAFFILLGLSAGIVYVLNNSHVVNQVNRILALHTPQLIRNLKRQRAR